MKINNQITDAKQFAFDGCHKIYLIESEADAKDAVATGYELFPIQELESAYRNSCGLRFINNWKLDTCFVPQFEEYVRFAK